MVYIVLNITIAFFLGFFTHLMDKQIKSDNIGIGSLAISMLLSTIEAVFFVLILLCKHFWFDALTHRMMQILLIINGILFIMLSFGLVEIAIEKKRNIVTALKLILYAVVAFYVFKNLPSMGLSIERGIEWNSKVSFSHGPGTQFIMQ